MSPASLLQILCQEQRSVVITAQRGLQLATIQLFEGLIISAQCAELIGKEAIYAWLAWDSGQFSITLAQQQSESVEMLAPWEELLLEAARRRDEIVQALVPLPPIPQQYNVDDLLKRCPALSGIALVGYDGRLLAVVGLEEDIAQQAATLVGGLAVVETALGNGQCVSLYATAKLRLLLANWGNGMFALAVPAIGSTIADASTQLSQCNIAYD